MITVSFDSLTPEIACLSICPVVILSILAVGIVLIQNFRKDPKAAFSSYEHAYFILTLEIFKTKNRSVLILGICIIALSGFSIFYAMLNVIEELFIIGIIIMGIGFMFLGMNQIENRYQNNIFSRTPPWGPFLHQSIREERREQLSGLFGYLSNLALLSRWIVVIASLLVLWGLGEFVYFVTVFDTYFYDNDPLIYLYVSVLKLILGITLFVFTNLLMIRPLRHYQFWHGMLSKG